MNDSSLPVGTDSGSMPFGLSHRTLHILPLSKTCRGRAPVSGPAEKDRGDELVGRG